MNRVRETILMLGVLLILAGLRQELAPHTPDIGWVMGNLYGIAVGLWLRGARKKHGS